VNFSHIPKFCDIFVDMVCSGLPSLHAILEESASEDDSTSSGGGSSSFPIPQDCNEMTLAVPIMTTVDVSYAAPQVHEIANVALYQEYSLGIVFIFS
jgi:hypothetical protein